MAQEHSVKRATTERLVEDLWSKDSTTLAQVALGKMDVFYDPIHQTMECAPVDAKRHESHLRMNINEVLCDHMLTSNPQLKDMLAEQLMISLQLQKDIVMERMNYIRNNLGVPEITEADLSTKKAFVGMIAAQNSEQSIMLEEKTGRQILFEHKNMMQKPVPNKKLQVTRPTLEAPWTARVLDLGAGLSQ
jgi:hypothetical protein